MRDPARALVLLLLLLPPGGCERGGQPRPEARRAAGPRCRAVGPVQGRLARDTTWCGQVLVVGNVLVPKGVTLTVAPGTVVRFRPYRGYKQPQRRLELRVLGTLVARGRPGRLIRFTSDASSPQNGDWSMVKLVNANGSKIAHAVFEFGQHGLNIWHTDIDISHVVIRFHNWEGLYAENHGNVKLTHSRIYANGYNCVAVEQFVDLVVESSYIANCGTVGILVDASEARIQGNLIEGSQEGLALDNDAEVTAVGNLFTGQPGGAISCNEGNNRLRLGGNDFEGRDPERAVHCPGGKLEDVASGAWRPPARLAAGVSEGAGAFLDYVPGDPRHDRYPYVFAERDETRQVTRRIGGKLGLTWSLAWDGEALWTASLSGELFRLDPESGRVLRRFRAPGPQPWGMTFDGRSLWISDFARRRLYAVDPHSGVVQRELPAPDPAGGCKGIAWDGHDIWVLGWATHRVYRISRETGKVLGSAPAPYRDLGGGGRRYVAGGLTWDGQAFWGPSDRLVRFDRQGRVLGWIHSTSERVWDLTWDGQALWTTQRANENWADFPRIFRVKVLEPRTD